MSETMTCQGMFSPRNIGTASCNWVRPIFTTSANSSAFLKKLLPQRLAEIAI